MPVTQDKPAPYAPSAVVLNLVGRYREKGLPAPITAEVLTRAGVTDSLNSRTLQALQALDLVDEEGRPTPVFEGLRLAPEAEYKNRMGEWLGVAYADALNFIDPATATETEIRDAFRSYKPVGQQDRMVSLFMGLCEAAGISPERKRKSAQKSSAPQNSLNAKVKAAFGTPRAPQQVHVPVQELPQIHTRGHAGPSLPPALSGLLTSLPPSGEAWSKSDRDRFVTTFEAVLDFCYPVSAGKRRNILGSDEEGTE